jgi:hypothetical protein
VTRVATLTLVLLVSGCARDAEPAARTPLEREVRGLGAEMEATHPTSSTT